MLLNARTHLQFSTAWKNYEVLSYFHIYQKAIKWLGDIDKRENRSLNWKVWDWKCEYIFIHPSGRSALCALQREREALILHPLCKHNDVTSPI